jgi:hypothetical protein
MRDRLASGQEAKSGSQRLSVPRGRATCGLPGGYRRALRPSVIFRRVTNGFRSEWGANVYADLCSVVATGRLAGRTALAAGALRSRVRMMRWVSGTSAAVTP